LGVLRAAVKTKTIATPTFHLVAPTFLFDFNPTSFALPKFNVVLRAFPFERLLPTRSNEAKQKLTLFLLFIPHMGVFFLLASTLTAVPIMITNYAKSILTLGTRHASSPTCTLDFRELFTREWKNAPREWRGIAIPRLKVKQTDG